MQWWHYNGQNSATELMVQAETSDEADRIAIKRGLVGPDLRRNPYSKKCLAVHADGTLKFYKSAYIAQETLCPLEEKT